MRLALRVVLYSLAIGLIVLTWQRTHGPTTQTQTAAQGPATQAHTAAHGPGTLTLRPTVHWVGLTKQGQPVRAVTVDGVLSFLETRIVTHCVDGSLWTLRLTMYASEFQRTGDVVTGRQGPALVTSDQGERVRVATRMRTAVRRDPGGVILSKVTRSPGPHGVHCSSHKLDYALSRAIDR